MPVTVKDLAKLAKVHHSTVVRALNGSSGEKISDAVRKRIRAIAERKGYRKNVRASRFKRGDRDIGVFVGMEAGSLHDNPFYLQVVSHLLVAAGRRGRRLVYCNLPPSTGGGMPEIIDDSLYSGLVMLGGSYPDYIEDIAGRIPVLQLFRSIPSRNMYKLIIDNGQASALILDYFRSNGIRNPLILYLKDDAIVKERIEYLLKTAKRAGAAIRPSLVEFVGRDWEMLLSGAYDAKLAELFLGHDCCLAFTGLGYCVHAALLSRGVKPAPSCPFMVYDNLPNYRQIFPGIKAFGLDYDKLSEKILAFFEQKARLETYSVKLEFFEGKPY